MAKHLTLLWEKGVHDCLQCVIYLVKGEQGTSGSWKGGTVLPEW